LFRSDAGEATHGVFAAEFPCGEERVRVARHGGEDVARVVIGNVRERGSQGVTGSSETVGRTSARCNDPPGVVRSPSVRACAYVRALFAHDQSPRMPSIDNAA
jgi:hypothetical protein